MKKLSGAIQFYVTPEQHAAFALQNYQRGGQGEMSRVLRNFVVTSLENQTEQDILTIDERIDNYPQREFFELTRKVETLEQVSKLNDFLSKGKELLGVAHTRIKNNEPIKQTEASRDKIPANWEKMITAAESELKVALSENNLGKIAGLKPHIEYCKQQRDKTNPEITN